MSEQEIILRRLYNQQIAESTCKKPAEVVSWLVAKQSQEWAMAKWAIGLRLAGSTDADIEHAFNNGDILRTHMMRPTWHFVTPADIRWLLALTAPRVNAFNAPYYRKMELDTTVFKRANTIFSKMLQGGKQLNRLVLKEALEKNKIKTNDLRFMLLLMRAELDGLICSGARMNKQFTYTLLEERVPATKSFYRDEALAQLVKRYFITRGPATIQDFVWWSGLTVRDAKEGLSMHGSLFTAEVIGGKEYIYAPAAIENKNKIQSTFLLPDYDEYGISYKDRSLLVNKKDEAAENKRYSHTIIIDGKAGGGWQPGLENKIRQVETSFLSPLSKTKQQAVKKAVKKYLSFTGK